MDRIGHPERPASMPSLDCTYAASADKPVQHLDVFHTDSGGEPSTATKTHDLGSERTAGGAAAIPLTAAQAPAGRRFAVKARNGAGSSGLSPVAVVPGGAVADVVTAYRDGVNARRQALSLPPLAAAGVTALNEFWLRLGDRDGEVGRDLRPPLTDAALLRSAHNVGGGTGAPTLRLRAATAVGPVGWLANGMAFNAAGNTLLNTGAPLIAGAGDYTVYVVYASDVQGTAHIVASQYDRGPQTGIAFVQHQGGDNSVYTWDGAIKKYSDRAVPAGVFQRFAGSRSGGGSYRQHDVTGKTARDTVGTTDADGPNGNPFVLGGTTNRDQQRAFDGKIAAAVVFSQKLTDAEVAALDAIYMSTLGAGLPLA